MIGVTRPDDGSPSALRCSSASWRWGSCYTPQGYVVPKKPYRGLEFWRDGVMEQKFEKDVDTHAAMHQAAMAFKAAGLL